MRPLKLSVCIIARNEERRIAAAIDSVRAVADEIIVLDTGSTDATIATSRSRGATVATFKWCDDFAAARNACQFHARGEWLFWLDADERLKPGEESNLRTAISDRHAAAHYIIREDFFAENRPDWFSEMYQLRLVRRDLECKWLGIIHEHLDPEPKAVASRSGKRVLRSPIRIQHWGYTSDRMPEKLRRAARLCELELRARPGQLYYLVEWARSLLALGDPKGHDALAQACAVLREHTNAPHPPSPLASSLIEQLLAMPAQKHFTPDELVGLSLKWFPNNAPLAWAVARTYTQQSKWPEAEKQLRHLLRLLETSTHDRVMSFDPRVGEDARINLSVALIRQGKIDDAEKVLTPLLTSERRAPEAKANLEAIKLLRERFT